MPVLYYLWCFFSFSLEFFILWNIFSPVEGFLLLLIKSYLQLSMVTYFYLWLSMACIEFMLLVISMAHWYIFPIFYTFAKIVGQYIPYFIHPIVFMKLAFYSKVNDIYIYIYLIYKNDRVCVCVRPSVCLYWVNSATSEPFGLKFGMGSWFDPT